METILKFLVYNLVFYLLGCFVAWDINPMSWWLFTSSFGRVMFIFYELYVINVSMEE